MKWSSAEVELKWLIVDLSSKPACEYYFYVYWLYYLYYDIFFVMGVLGQRAKIR